MSTRVTGITGGIGSGKSVVSRVLRLKGFRVYDCDTEARRIMESPGGIVRRRLEERFGKELFLPDGSLDRRRLASLMFGDPETLAWVNATVHSAVRADIREWTAGAEAAGEGRVWIESAILAGSGLTGECQDVWLVTAPEEVRVERAVGRGMTRGDAVARLRSQAKEETLLAECDIPVCEVANGPDDSLLDRIGQLLGDMA